LKLPAFLTVTPALGDQICATPTIRKLSEIYASKVAVISHVPDLFRNLPYVSECYHINDVNLDEISSQYDLHKTFHLLGKTDSLGIEFKHAICDIRQFHAKDLGFMLKDEEMSCDFIPSADPESIDQFNLPKEYVVLHPVQSWDSRSWAKEKWQDLSDKLENAGMNVVTIGRDSGEQQHRGKLDKPAFNIDLKKGIDLVNKTSLDQSWHILKNSKAVITMDSGVMHLAGTTDTHIFQLGSNLDPKFRAPYRNGSQNYKYNYILGGCSIHCASDLRYSLRDWGAIQNVTLIDTCLEPSKNFECHPPSEKVFKVVSKVLSGGVAEIKDTEIVQQDEIKNKELIKIVSKSLGDNIGAMAVIEARRKTTGNNISVICKLDAKYFKESYPQLKILPHDQEPVLDPSTSTYLLEGERFSKFTRIFYDFHKPLIKGYADQIDVEKWERPKIDLFAKERPLDSKYVCFSMHSTAQAKHWNYKDGWEILCSKIRERGLIPVCIDYHESFGIEGNWNQVPKNALKRQGLSIDEVTNYIHHSEFFIGISSGLSWVAHALGKKVVMISGLTSEDHEFSEDTYRLTNKSVCNGCLNKKGVSFDAGDWMWCPFHKNTDRQFECTTTITPEDVMSVIDSNLMDEIVVEKIEHEEDDKNIRVSFTDGPKVEILGKDDGSLYEVFFYNTQDGKSLLYKDTVERGQWVKSNRSYFTEWEIEIYRDGVLYHTEVFDCSEKDVLIRVMSTALGDNISWIGYAEEFRKKHNCDVTVFCRFSSLFEKLYPSITFVNDVIHDKSPYYCSYDITLGIDSEVHRQGMKKLNQAYQKKLPIQYVEDLTFFDIDKHPEHPMYIPMQKVASNILGLEYFENRPLLTSDNNERPIEEKYICISEFASAYTGMKLWNNRKGWQTVVDYLKKLGYTVVSISKEKSSLKGVVKRNGTYELEDRIWYLKHSEFFIGLPSGLSWLSWATGKKTVMIGGFSEDWYEFQEDNIRIKNYDACNGCFNSEEHADKLCCYHATFCPENKNFECSRKISPKMVIESIEANNLISAV
jgi:autotransporter strand-loop-strand O-heptosyltransferase